MWSFINSRGDPDDKGWAKVRQSELKNIVNRNADIADIKRLFDAQGWAEWKEGTPHRMRVHHTGETVVVKLVFKSTNRILGSFTGRERACKIARRSLDLTEIDVSYAKEIIRDIYLRHIRRREFLREKKGLYIPFTREEERKLIELKMPDKYNNWMMKKASRVNASIINPMRQICHHKGAVFRVPKSNGHRLFTPFAFLKRELRKAVRLEGERLVALDVRSCQPTLLANKTGDLDLVEDCYHNRFYNYISDHLEEHSPHPFTPDLTDDQWTEEEKGRIALSWPKMRTPLRDRAKMAVMEYLFGPNKDIDWHEGKDQLLLQEFMFQKYPKTAKYVYDQKEKMFYGQVARDLQAAESKFFIDQFYCTDLHDADILGLTVHDAVYVKESDADRAEEIFRERLATEGLKASLDRESKI